MSVNFVSTFLGKDHKKGRNFGKSLIGNKKTSRKNWEAGDTKVIV